MPKNVGAFADFGPPVTSLPATGNYNGRTCVLNGVPYIYVASAWKDATPGTGGTGGTGTGGGPRIVQGQVNANGTIAYGTGYTVTRTAVGRYSIALTVPFGGVITPTVAEFSGGTGSERNIRILGSNAGGFDIAIYDDGSVNFVDSPFTFFAADPTYVADAKAYVGVGTPWTAMTGMGWNMIPYAGYQAPQYRRDETGRVHIRGLVQTQTAYGVGTKVFFTLPAGFRPSATELFDIELNDAQGRIDIGADGTMNVGTAVTAGGYISLSGMNFQADGQGMSQQQIAGTPWIPASLPSGWSGSAFYYKDMTGKVHLKGFVTATTTKAAGSTVVNIPDGFRPPASYIGVALYNSGPVRTDVTAAGNVTNGPNMVANDWISLDGISYMEASGPYTLGASTTQRVWGCPYPWWSGGSDAGIPNTGAYTLLTNTAGNDPTITVPATADQKVLEIVLRVTVRADSANWTDILAIARGWVGSNYYDFVAEGKSNTAASWNGGTADWRTLTISDIVTVTAGQPFSAVPYVRCTTPYGGAYARAIGYSAFHVKRVD
jgi:hypothetical protein